MAKDSEEGRVLECSCGFVSKIDLGVEANEMRDHLTEKHGFDPQQKIKRRLMMHGDGSKYYVYMYEWVVGEAISIVDTTTHKRR